MNHNIVPHVKCSLINDYWGTIANVENHKMKWSQNLVRGGSNLSIFNHRYIGNKHLSFQRVLHGKI